MASRRQHTDSGMDSYETTSYGHDDAYDRERERRRRRRKQQRLRQVRRRKIMLAGTCIILIAGIGGSITAARRSALKAQALEAARLEEEEKAREEEEALLREQTKDENTIHFVAVGDNLIHSRIYKSTADMTAPVWNYDHLYENIKDDISSADLAAVNQETILVADHSNISTYPDFGSPTEIGDALVDAGFDIVEQASNHTYDKGVAGIQQTIDFWKTRHPEIAMLGIHESQEDADTIKTIECKGVTFALLNYTSFLNQEEHSDLPSYMVDFLTVDRLRKDIAKAKECSDYIIAFLHTGIEYSEEPSDEQNTMLSVMLSEGVDIAICAHPHVLQNFDTLTDDNGNQMLVYYSLGNFISTQDETACLLGGMADITIYHDPVTDEISVEDAQLIPLVTHYNFPRKEFAVYKLEDYTDELAAENSIHEVTKDPFDLDYLHNRYEKVISARYDTEPSNE